MNYAHGYLAGRIDGAKHREAEVMTAQRRLQILEEAEHINRMQSARRSSHPQNEQSVSISLLVVLIALASFYLGLVVKGVSL